MNIEDKPCGEGTLADRTSEKRQRRGLWYEENIIFCEHSYKTNYNPGGYIYMIRKKDEEEFGHCNSYENNGDIINRVIPWKRLRKSGKEILYKKVN